jgi:ribosomal protein S4
MSDWINYVKKVAKEKGLKYNEALKVASKEYHKEKGTTPKAKKPKTSSSGKRLTGKQILKHLKKKVDSGEIHKGQSKKKMSEVLRGGGMILDGVGTPKTE